MPIRLIATGGTFDKVYDPIQGTLTFDQTTLHDIAAQAGLGDSVVIQQAMLIDSLFMTDDDRRLLVSLCFAAPEDRIVIVHGTDTLLETAAKLDAANLRKTIVLTGAMVPYRVARSDALFNLGHAVGIAQHAPPGIHVAMNGQSWRWDQVRKNRELGRFEAKPAN